MQTVGARYRCRVAGTTLVAIAVLASCSTLNREGPDVTCEDLENGAVNACRDGIIARCMGDAVTFEVCTSDDSPTPEEVCEASWQVEGVYRCRESDPLEP